MAFNVLRKESGDLIPVVTNDEYFGNISYDTPYLVINSKTTIFTESLAPCVGIAICAKDINGLYHRIICHCPYAPPTEYIHLEGRIEKYLKSIEITDLEVVIASFNTFFEIELSDYSFERNSLIINRINKMLSFWKETHPDFEVTVIQSSSIGINPKGEFICDSEEVKKENYLMQTSYESFNTTYTEETNTLSSINERLHQYANNSNYKK